LIKDNLNKLYKALPEGVKLVAVSKFHPVERLMEAYDAGQRIFGENRPQELAAKVPQMPSDVQWHFIGHLQTNKLKLVLPYVSLVQSVDSLHLLEAISNWAVANGRVINVLLELHLGAEETKHGLTEEEILSVLRKEEGTGPENCGRPWPHEWEGPAGRLDGRQVNLTAGKTDRGRDEVEDRRFSGPVPSSFPGVCICGLMGMATNTDDMSVVEKDFERIEGLFKRLQAQYPQLTELSIGMSGDWPLAVKHGATMVRIGTDIFGPREY
jgi:uncharacterized pyridoxal phosphate-containing UPF0001 family protein